MILRIVKKDSKNVIFPLVKDFTVTASSIYIYREIPDRGAIIESTEIIKRSEVEKLEVKGL